jgi:hypothetical protein
LHKTKEILDYRFAIGAATHLSLAVRGKRYFRNRKSC